MLLLIDNYDSFTFNVYQLLATLGCDVTVVRNDAISVEDVERLAPEQIVISPGPGGPASAGVSLEVVRRLGPRIPTLGVCLGHQCIGAAYGARVERAGELVHGKTSAIQHEARGVFAGLPSPFLAVRYHSLVVDEASVPPQLEVTARSEHGLVMGLRHREHPIEGVQFHPESILSEHGEALMRNFLAGSGRGSVGRRAEQGSAA